MNPEEQQRIDAWTKAQTQFLSAAFEHATRYSNIFILAGYGTFFGLWNVTRDQLYGRRLGLGAAMSMLLSAAIFVSYQIFTVYRSSSSLTRLYEALLKQPPQSIEVLVAKYEEYGLAEKKSAAVLLKVWRPMFVVTAGTGLLGIGLLAWVLAQGLVSCQVPLSCR